MLFRGIAVGRPSLVLRNADVDAAMGSELNDNSCIRVVKTTSGPPTIMAFGRDAFAGWARNKYGVEEEDVKRVLEKARPHATIMVWKT